MLLKFELIFVIFYVSVTESANILSVVCSTSQSHHILVSALLRELSNRNHNVTIISPFVDRKKIPNYHQIYLDGFVEEKERIQHVFHPNTSVFNMVGTRMASYVELSKKFWKNKHVVNLIETKPKYDVVIVEYSFTDSYLALGHVLNAPVIIFSTYGFQPFYESLLGHAVTPYYFAKRHEHPNFVRRLAYFLTALIMNSSNKFITDQSQDEILSNLPGSPKLDEVRKSIALILVNTHYSYDPPRSFLPNMIPIGGFNLKDSKPLPKDIESFLNGAKNGAILFSFGGNVKISTIEEQKLKIILNVLGNLPLKVVFKSEISLPNVADNIKVLKWVPQNDILGHPNLKAFITHGGMGGTTEALYHGVPMLGVPFFGDQEKNLVQRSLDGYAILLKYKDITEDSFSNSLKDILYNETYKEKAKKYSKLLKEQPIHPMDNAVFWIEHTIKYNGTSHLKHSGVYLRWYELYMVDIILFFTVIVMLLTFITCKSTKTIFKYLIRRVSTKNNKFKLS